MKKHDFIRPTEYGVPIAEEPSLQHWRVLIAKELLIEMMHTPGDRYDKVRAAVEYADALLAELGVTETT